MTTRSSLIARALVLMLAFSLCGGPQLAQAQSAAGAAQQPPSQQPPSQQPAAQPQGGQQPAPPSDRGLINPSQGPLQPVTPGQTAPAPSQEETTAPPSPPPEAPAPQNNTERPLGAAVGQTGETTGGPASRPAGAAIAPAKQHQVRSLFIKIGAIAAAGAAVGAVVALSRGTPSNPPGAR